MATISSQHKYVEINEYPTEQPQVSEEIKRRKRSHVYI